MLNITQAGPGELESWQRFVDDHPHARPMHHAGWYGVLNDAFAVEPRFLIARRNREVTGVLPLYWSRSIFTGSHIASLDDGPLVNGADSADALLEAAIEHRDRVRAKYVLIRTGEPLRLSQDPDAVRMTVRRLIHTRARPEDLFASLSGYARRDVRRAEKRGYHVGNDGALEALDGAFYDEYARQMHELGTPVMDRAFMTAMRKHLGPRRLRLYVLRREDAVVGGMLCAAAPERWSALYAAVRPDANADYANYLLYWHALSEACRAGVPELDLGRNTPGSGPHKFKQKWTGEDRFAEHLYFAQPGASLEGIDSFYGGSSFKQRIWSTLPLALANIVGPMLRKRLPFG